MAEEDRWGVVMGLLVSPSLLYQHSALACVPTSFGMGGNCVLPGTRCVPTDVGSHTAETHQPARAGKHQIGTQSGTEAKLLWLTGGGD